MKREGTDDGRLPAHVTRLGNIRIWGRKNSSTNVPNTPSSNSNHTTTKPRAFPLGHINKKKPKGSAASGWQRQAMQRAHSSHDIVGSDGSITPVITPVSSPRTASGRDSGNFSFGPTETAVTAAKASYDLQQQQYDDGIPRTSSTPSRSVSNRLSPRSDDSSSSPRSTQQRSRSYNATITTNTTATHKVPTTASTTSTTSTASTASTATTATTATAATTATNETTETTATNTASTASTATTANSATTANTATTAATTATTAATATTATNNRLNSPTNTANSNTPPTSPATLKKRKKARKPHSPQKWERVLWKRQTKEDNYVPDTWLHSVNRRTNTYGQGYWNMVKHTAVLMQQLSIVVVFSTVYRLALTEDTEIVQGAAPSISLSHLLLIDFGIIVSFYIIHFVLSLQIKVPQDSAGAAHAFFMQPHRIILFLVILMAVSPVLHTLTKAYASDTIYMLAMFLGSLHIFFYDFTYTLSQKREFKCTVSMNAALLTGVLLASRLSSNLHCFALMCFSLELFTLSPILRHMLREYSENIHLIFTTILVLAVGIVLFFTHELFFSTLWLTASTVLPFFAPYLFISAQVYKSVLFGPWDLGRGYFPIENPPH